MEHVSCNVIYADRQVQRDRCVAAARVVDEEWESDLVARNVCLLLEIFGEVYLCSAGGPCLTQWLNLQDVSMVDLKPTLILIDTPCHDRLLSRSRSREPSPHSAREMDEDEEPSEELYGLALLQRIVSESYLRNLSKLVIPVPLIRFSNSDAADGNDGAGDAMDVSMADGFLGAPNERQSRRSNNWRLVRKCLDSGATDVVANPISAKCATNLEVHAYRAHREATREQKALLEIKRGRKRSWVGISEEKPFSYLRETMVSCLLTGICRGDLAVDEAVNRIKVSVPAEKQAKIAEAIGHWSFCAHDFSDDELIIAASAMFKHALSMPELEPWRIPTDQLHSFVIACRAAYNDFVPYHNFRHVVDVLQATFNFLVHIGALPRMGEVKESPSHKSPTALLLDPFEAFTLLITAIGHDVGHPGVNNGFLTQLNAPLAQLYNDRSVLESFHCAAYSQILRRYWYPAFSDKKMRHLMISSILATDMGLHQDYMKRLGDLQDRLCHDKSTDGWCGRMLDEQKALTCALLIKCADISNVARKYDTAVQWMHILSDEFARQASMEVELEIPSSLIAPPKQDAVSLAKAQLGFMNFFAIPLFQGVADLLPAMQYCVDELDANKRMFEQCVQEARCIDADVERGAHHEGSRSTRSPSSAFTVEQVKYTPLPTEEIVPPTTLAENGTSLAHMPVGASEYRRVSGIRTSFEDVEHLACNDPFRFNDGLQGPAKQRCSETTEGSVAPYPGDSASQATSATTGKMPLSPSTQGTSIISRDSLERPASVPVTAMTLPHSTKTTTTTTTTPGSAGGSPEERMAQEPPGNEDDPTANGNVKVVARVAESEADCGPRTLRKKGSRFRLNALNIFRKHKAPNQPIQATDAAR